MRVNLSAVTPQVDVIPDGFDWANVIIAGISAVFGLGGFVAAIVAIVLARRAQRTADEAVTGERRRVFELEILRDLVTALDEGGVASEVYDRPLYLHRFGHRLSLLSARLPFWDQIMRLKDTGQVAQVVGVGDQYRVLMGAVSARKQDEEDVEKRLVAAWTRAGAPETSSDEQRAAAFEQVEKLQREKEKIWDDQKTLDAKLRQVKGRGSQTLHTKLAYDIQQRILSNVEARRPHRTLFQRWWYGVR